MASGVCDSTVLQVRVADAQGLRLHRGGEIRLVLTLRASDDPQGEAFGAKVTPWLSVPDGEAPQWRAREATFAVPADRCFQAEFVDTAQLHIELMQRGFLPPHASSPPASNHSSAVPESPSPMGATGMPGLSGAAAALGSAGGSLTAWGAALRPSRGSAALSAALQGASTAIQTTSFAWPLAGVGGGAGSAAERGDVMGILALSVGKRLVRAGTGNDVVGDSSWVELREAGSPGGGGKVKGSLLLELAAAHRNVGPPPPPPSTSWQQPPRALGVEGHPLPPSCSSSSNAPPPPPPPAPPPPPMPPHSSGSLTEEDAAEESDAVGSGADASDSTAATVGGQPHHQGFGLPDSPSAVDCAGALAAGTRAITSASTMGVGSSAGDSWESKYLEADHQISAKAVADLLANAEKDDSQNAWEAPPTEWLPFGRGGRNQPAHAMAAADGHDGFNIFTINDPSVVPSSSSSGGLGSNARGASDPGLSSNRSSASATAASGAGRQLRSLFGKLTRKPGQRIRSTLDPNVRKGRREVRKWRRRHEIFVVLNEIERCLGEASKLLVQAAASMKRFGESHGSLQDAPFLSAFLCDAALYFRSEAEIPSRLEAHLCELERVADEFRCVAAAALGPSEGPSGAEPGQTEPLDSPSNCTSSALRRECADLQIDIAVLLESALMTAQQALAEYKKMHCRLELVATEYEPLCRLELDISAQPAFLPLLADETTRAEAASLPEQAVKWALDFSHLVGTSSRGLEGLVRELEHRKRRLADCAAELRDALLRHAASAVAMQSVTEEGLPGM
mmetsp:Transcript_148465/g.377651  ORF Transcript_148465/g.377651 Transcript_148465/m.377651 type:complete len:792 (-) Transcript_148465:201-2576(-)